LSLKQFACLASLVVLLAACSVDDVPPQSVPATAPPAAPASTAAPSAAKTVAPKSTAAPTPAPTQGPPAARVNGRPVPLAEFEKEVARRQATLVKDGINFDTPDGKTALAVLRQQTLDGLIEQELLDQEAAKQNITVAEPELDAAINQIIAESGSMDDFNKYLKASEMTLDELRTGQRKSMLNQKLYDRVTRDVPMTAEQVHARHILVNTLAEANALLAQLHAGADFATLAQQYSKDSTTSAGGGDLGWFPRGGLFDAALEQAAFELQPGQISKAPVQSDLGGGQVVYHILQVIERDPARTLSDDALRAAREAAFQRWLEGLKASAKIERLVK
jgi:parvulin-like peptidyl-prolyl isomerase